MSRETQPKMAVFGRKSSVLSNPVHLSFTHLVAQHFALDVFVRQGFENPITYCDRFPFQFFNFREDSIEYLRQFAIPGNGGYDVIVAIDPCGLQFCNALLPDSRPIYYSAELYHPDEPYYIESSEGTREVLWLEKELLQKCSGLIIQSPARETVFRQIHPTFSKPVFHMPLVSEGYGIKERSHYCHDQYNIPKNLKILVHLSKPHHSAELEKAMHSIQESPDWALLIHGSANSTEIVELKKWLQDTDLQRIYFTNEFFEDAKQTNNILESADAGFVWFRDNHYINQESAGFSSGRIVQYLKHGLPVITNGFTDFRNAIELCECGYCMDSLTELPEALESVNQKYSAPSENIIAEYNRRYRFESCRAELFDFLSQNQTERPSTIVSDTLRTLEYFALSSLLGISVESVKDNLGVRKCYLWGAGLAGEILGRMLLRYGFTEFEYLDSNPDKAGTHLNNRPISHPNNILDEKNEKPVVFITSSANKVIAYQLRSAGFKAGADFYFLYP